MYLEIILPILSTALAQIIKLFTNKDKAKKRNKLFAYSGFPSGHTALVTSLAVIIGLKEGFESTFFAISLILAVLIITDALGLRTYLGKHGKQLNALVKDLDEDKYLDEKYPKLLEKIGHSPIQVIAGVLLGTIISIFGYLLFA